MKSAGIKDLKNQLSRYLAYVKRGEDVVITERSVVIARIIQESSEKRSLREAFQPLIRQGLITFPTNPIDKDIPEPLDVPGKRVSKMAIEDRR